MRELCEVNDVIDVIDEVPLQTTCVEQLKDGQNYVALGYMMPLIYFESKPSGICANGNLIDIA